MVANFHRFSNRNIFTVKKKKLRLILKIHFVGTIFCGFLSTAKIVKTRGCTVRHAQNTPFNLVKGDTEATGTQEVHEPQKRRHDTSHHEKAIYQISGHSLQYLRNLFRKFSLCSTQNTMKMISKQEVDEPETQKGETWYQSYHEKSNTPNI